MNEFFQEAIHNHMLFFWPVVVLIAMVLIILSVRFLVKIMLFVVAVIVIWYSLAYVGLVPAPNDYFKKYERKKTGVTVFRNFRKINTVVKVL